MKRKEEFFMKRIMAAILSLSIVFSLVACQPTPQKGVVAEKDSERLLEEAQKDSANASSGKSLSEQYGIPESYQFETTGANGKLNIIADAQVIIPGSDRMPIYRTKLTEFSQETVSAFFQALCSDTEMWIVSNQLTKEQVQQAIIKFKQRIAEIKDDLQLTDELTMCEQTVAELEQQLEIAPDTLAEVRTDGTLTETTDAATDAPQAPPSAGGAESTTVPAPQTSSTHTALDAYERYKGGAYGSGRTFQVNNGTSPLMTYSDFRNPAANINFASSISLPVLEDADVDEGVLSKIELKPSEAKHMVQELLDMTGSGMVVDSIYLRDDAQYNDDSIVQPAEHYAYMIYCVRTTDGFPCSYVAGSIQPEAGAAAPYWQYENMYFMVNNEGIFKMDWTCPIEVVETVNQDAQLKPFSEIREIFEKMMLVKYEAQAESSQYDFEINRVTLSLHRIIERNSNETGLLVPAWNFYGKWTIADSTGGQFELLGESFLTINAIDGSIIDISKGY